MLILNKIFIYYIMTKCYKTSDNYYYNCAPKMQDGRSFTDYRANCTLDNMVSSSNNIQSSYEYRLFLQRNGKKLINKFNDYNYKMNGCNDCGDTMLAEQSELNCSEKGCNKTINDINGLGLGRNNGNIDNIWEKQNLVNNPENECNKPSSELLNFYHTMNYEL